MNSGQRNRKFIIRSQRSNAWNQILRTNARRETICALCSRGVAAGALRRADRDEQQVQVQESARSYRRK